MQSAQEWQAKNLADGVFGESKRARRDGVAYQPQGAEVRK